MPIVKCPKCDEEYDSMYSFHSCKQSAKERKLKDKRIKHDWTKFRGTRNDRTTLMDKAAALTPVMIQIAENAVLEIEALVEGRSELKVAEHDVRQFINVQKIDKRDRSNAIWEFLLFLLHMTYRIAFENLGTSKRDTFMIVLWEDVGKEMLRRTKQFVPAFMIGHPLSGTYRIMNAQNIIPNIKSLWLNKTNHKRILFYGNLARF